MNTPNKTVQKISPSIYVIVKARCCELLHDEGFLNYETAKAKASALGGVVSSLKFMRKKYGPTCLPQVKLPKLAAGYGYEKGIVI